MGDGIDAGHADILQDLHMFDVFIAKGHPETDAFKPFNVLNKGFQFLVIEEVAGFIADFGVIDHFAEFERGSFDPFAIFPIFPALRDFTQVDFRIEIGGKGLTMITRVAINDIDVMDLIKQVFLRVGTVNIGLTGIKTAAKNGGDAGFFEFILIRPLPFIFEFGFVDRFVIGGVHVMGFGFKTCVHDREVLVRERHIDNKIRFDVIDECNGVGDVIRVKFGNADVYAVFIFTDFLDFFTFGDCTAGEVNGCENIAIHCAFLCDD